MDELDSVQARRREESDSRAEDSGEFEARKSQAKPGSADARKPGSKNNDAGATSRASLSAIEPGLDAVTVDSVMDTPALRNSNALLFVIAAGVCTVFTIVVLLTRHYEVIGLFSYSSMVLSAVLGWLAYALRERGHQQIWAAAIGVATINSIAPLSADLVGTIPLSSLLIILTWAGMLLRPRWNILLGAYASGLIVASGGDLTLAPANTSEVGEYPLPVLLAYLLVPIGIGATLHLRQRTLESQVRAGISKLEHQREELARKLQGKIDELELSREQLFEAQKLKTVGTMASGLAHELNNILTPIRGHAELIAEGVSNPEQTRRYGQRILDSAAAAASITGALLTYTRQGTFQPVRSNLRQLLQGQILPVLSKSLPGNVRLKVDLARNVSVDVDRVLFQQAIANLVFNAVDAMPEGGEIVIALSTSNRSPTEEDDEDDDEATHRSAVVTVSDTGTGIDDAHIEQIFDPFFTTKAVGSGSGLGLAMVMGTVTRHHGRVLVESVIGGGTTFTLLLPLAASDDKKDSPHKPWPVLGDASKGPVVVVLTDDQDALDEFEELLETTECAPICTSDVKGATPLLTEMGDKVDLLILDLEIEGADTTRLFKSVRELFPEMPVILLSDQPTDPTVQRMIGAGPTRSVRKPMDGRLFSAMLTDLLHPGEGYVRDFTPVPINPGADVSGPHPRAG